VQTQLLTEYPSDQISIYAVWLRMLVRDSSDEWDASIMTDARVKHFWDGGLELRNGLPERWMDTKELPGMCIISTDPMRPGKLSLRRLWVRAAPLFVSVKNWKWKYVR